MKVKRLLGAFLALCTLLSCLSGVSIVAADVPELTYRLNVDVCDSKGADCPDKKVSVYLRFRNGTQKEAKFINCKRNSTGYACFGTKEPPWNIESIYIKNSSDNSLWMHKLRLEVKKSNQPDDMYKAVSTHLLGTEGNRQTGMTVDENDGGPQDRTFEMSAVRKISNLSNFYDQLNKVYHFSPRSTNDSSYITGYWDGKINDNFYALYGSYDYRTLAKAPTYSVEISGKGADNYKVTQSDLEKEAELSFLNEGANNGFKISRGKLVKYMNDHDVNMITLKFKVNFESSNTQAPCEYVAETKFVRDRIEIETTSLKTSTNYYQAGTDVYYYNGNKNEKKITVTGTIKTTGNYSHFANGYFKGRIFSFDSAYLKVGDKKIQCQMYSKTENKYYNVKGVELADGKTFSLDFFYEDGDDSLGNGVTLLLNNVWIKDDDTASWTYRVWNDAFTTNDFSHYFSKYRVDAKKPTVDVKFADGTNTDAWNKSVNFSYTASEDIYIADDNSRSPKRVNFALYQGNSPVAIYNPLNSAGTDSGNTWALPAGENSSTDARLLLKAEEEGVFDLVFSGEDEAGNDFTQKTSKIRLDGKPPKAELSATSRAALEREGLLDEEKSENGTAAEGEKTSKDEYFKIDLDDGSGTGKLYYMFTRKPVNQIDYDCSGAVQHKSGSLTTLEDTWSYIDESDFESGKVKSLYFSVPEGKNFDGRVVFFGKDAAGNETSPKSLDFDLTNENTMYTVSSVSKTKPSPSYEISVDTNVHNTVNYRWWCYAEEAGVTRVKYITDSKRYNGIFDTAADANTAKLNGTYYLEVEIIPPSGASNKVVANEAFVFDNEGPKTSFTVPSDKSYRQSQNVTVRANDATGVVSGSAAFVTPAGGAIEGFEEFQLSPANGIVNKSPQASGFPSGAYALKVSVGDTHGFNTEAVSAPFFIRNGAPSGSVSVSGGVEYSGLKLIADEEVMLDFDITEAFANASAACDQLLYYRIGTSYGKYGEWIAVGKMEKNDTGFVLNAEKVKIPSMALEEGLNTIYVQTAIFPEDGDMSLVQNGNIRNDEISFCFDETAPTAELVVDNVHTTESITGKLYVSDNLDTEFRAECEASGVSVGEFNSEGYFDVTFTESGKAQIYVYDSAGNKTLVEQEITGVDRTAPAAFVKTEAKTVGVRNDAVAEITINDAAAETVKFALIPKDEYKGGNIPNDYFNENLPQDIRLRVSSLRNDKAIWPGESNLVYSLYAAGVNGTYYFGVRSADSLGNTSDVVFTDNPVTLKSEELSLTYTIKPKNAETKTLVNLQFNMPVFVLPQDKIVDITSTVFNDDSLDVDFTNMTDEEKVEAANLELARHYAQTYSEKSNFAISAYGEYVVYAVDDLDRARRFTVKVTEDDVEFNSSGDVTAKRVKIENGSFTEIPEKDWICAATWSDTYYVLVEPKDPDTLLLPEKSLYDTMYDTDYRERHALCFDFDESQKYALDFQNSPVSGGGIDNIKGYKKLIYRIEQLELMGVDVLEYTDDTERFFTVRAFNKENNPNEAPEQVDEKYLVVSNIDNTAPKVSWYTTPNVFSVDEKGDDVINPTPGDVTFTLDAQDYESGINGVVALGYYEEGDYVTLPGNDFNFETDDYWSWDGSEHTITWYDDDGREQTGHIPVKIELINTTDKYGVKTLRYTFTDEFSLRKGDFTTGKFYNTHGAEGEAYYGTREGDLSSIGLLYKMPIEKGEDYNVKYYFKNSDDAWEEITDVENTYYKNAKAVIELTERGQNRGLYVSNNGGLLEKALNSYQSSFTFRLGDKYGYENSENVSLDNFDVTPGTIEYTLSTTANTNKPITLSVTAADDKSGVAKVIFKSGSDELPIVENGSAYTAEIPQNGTYSIIMYDRVGNKAVKNFNVKNIDTTEPKATVVYSCGDKEWGNGEAKDFYTSRPVTATLYFTKNNVNIVSVEPIAPLTPSDYSINYTSSMITFTKSGTVGVVFSDEYGNTGSEVIAIGNIDKTPPRLEPVIDTADLTVARVTFNKLDDLTSEMDKARKESDIFVTYGGIIKTVSDEEGNKNTFEFNQNGNYTFKVYDSEGLSSYLDVTIDGIDKKAPVITKVSWSYKYEEYDSALGTWVEKTATDTKIPANGTVGYRVAADENKVTNKDVTVTVETDTPTKLVSGVDEYTTTKEKTYDENGMFIFNTEKKNGLISSYGVDIQVIDKTPPVIDLGENADLTFYQNPSMNSVYSKDLLTYSAYDVFNGVRTELTDKVTIDWGGFDHDDIEANKFDSSKPYTITYTVSDAAHNEVSVKRTIRLVGMTDTIVLVNGQVPNSAGDVNVFTDTVKLSLKNFSGTAYVRYQQGVKSMAQMKKGGTMLEKTPEGEFEISNLANGWYTFLVQTDKRDYFTIGVFVFK